MLTAVLWSKLGVWLADLRIARARADRRCWILPRRQTRLPLVSTSSVPYTGELGILIGRLPGDAAVDGTLELHAAAAAVNAVVCLVLEPVPRAVGLIDREPLLIAASGASLARRAPSRIGRRLIERHRSSQKNDWLTSDWRLR